MHAQCEQSLGSSWVNMPANSCGTLYSRTSVARKIRNSHDTRYCKGHSSYGETVGPSEKPFRSIRTFEDGCAELAMHFRIEAAEADE